jgi:hypothetical protein
MVATAASATVSNVAGVIGTEAVLSVQIPNKEGAMVRLPDHRSADRLPTLSRHCLLSVSIDPLNKVDASLIPEAYIYLLGVQCLVSLADGLVRYTFPLCNIIVVQNHPRLQASPCMHQAHSTLPETEPARARC